MIAIACDHGGFRLKNAIIDYLEQNGIEYKDFGAYNDSSCDYPDYAKKVALCVKNNECEKGILVCGTGIGMSMAANKVCGIRAAVCHDTFSAKATRAHNDANILCLGQRVVGEGLALEVVGAFLNTEFEGDRHQIRVNKITDIENEQ